MWTKHKRRRDCRIRKEGPERPRRLLRRPKRRADVSSLQAESCSLSRLFLRPSSLSLNIADVARVRRERGRPGTCEEVKSGSRTSTKSTSRERAQQGERPDSVGQQDKERSNARMSPRRSCLSVCILSRPLPFSRDAVWPSSVSSSSSSSNAFICRALRKKKAVMHRTIKRVRRREAKAAAAKQGRVRQHAG